MKSNPRFCEGCGATLAPDVKFCEDCGKKVEPRAGSAENELPSPVREPAPRAAEVSPRFESGGRVPDLPRIGALELARRLLLLSGVIAFVVLYMVAAKPPLLRFEATDFARQQEHYGGPYIDEQEKAVRQLPLEGFIRHITQGKVIPAEGGAWQAFFSELAGGKGSWKGLSLSKRKSRSPGSESVYFFRGDELSLFADLAAGTAAGKGGEFYLRPESGSWEHSYRLGVIYFTDEDFGLGEGLRTFPKPPGAVLYPWRTVGWIPLLAGLSLYCGLGLARKVPSGAFRCSQRPLIIGDFLGSGVAGAFVFLALLIVGSATLAFGSYFPFTAVMIALALFGVAILAVDAHYASWALRFVPGGLQYRSLFRSTTLAFEDLASFALVTKKPSKWLVRLLWLGALFGRGGISATAAGQAAMLSGSQAGGIEFKLKEGSSIFLWLTDMMGAPIVAGVDKIYKQLKDAGIEEATAGQ